MTLENLHKLPGHCFHTHFVCISTLCNYSRMDNFVQYIEQIYLEFLRIFHEEKLEKILIKHFPPLYFLAFQNLINNF